MKSKSSYLLAGAVALAVAGWMQSDDLFGKADGAASQESVLANAETKTHTSGNAGNGICRN